MAMEIPHFSTTNTSKLQSAKLSCFSLFPPCTTKAVTSSDEFSKDVKITINTFLRPATVQMFAWFSFESASA
jgi:hypothetical protein